MKKVLSLFLITIFLFSAYFIKAQSVKQPDVIINEIAWMGTTISANDEWLELKNNTDQNINLDGWTLRAADGAPEIKLTGTISANSFYLLERTDDNTVPNITADLVYKGALGNNGEDLWLYDGNNNLIDEANFTSGWIGGDNATKQTMEKYSNGWQTSKNVGGTPKSQNIVGSIKETPAKTIETPIKTDLPQTYQTGVILNEILPAPEGADEEKEWIELYNTNNFEIDLSGWKIKDKEGSATNYVLPKNTKISAYGYLVLKRP
ncbi:MAG: lamin tail domain-containing protein, partial [Candidatus Staskawiczbacteria bacterium]|nr:lamin tail domain-containing protein [Candidatus Staskawiczbacteria bacterium]